MAPTSRPRPYKDFLTPALHRWFSTAAATLLGLCFVEAILIGEWKSVFWALSPFGPTGIRAGLLFVCAFSIFVLRVAQLHIGLRTTKSGFETLRRYGFRLQTIQTLCWYLFSAWLYGEVYIFSAPTDYNITWIIDSKGNERRKLNERPIYLLSYFLMLACLQAGYHICYDYDRIEMPVTKANPEAPLDVRARLVIPPSTMLKAVFPAILASVIKRTLLMIIVGPLIYTLHIRHAAWSWTLYFAKLFWNLPRSTALPVITPFYFTFLARKSIAGFLLMLLWEVGNAAFSAHVAQAPLKNDRPITYESRDPNGSLLTGLQGKKLQTRAFALWELVCIAHCFEGRRKAIYDEIDRKGGSTWSQILKVCLEDITGIDSRIKKYENSLKDPKRVDDSKNDSKIDSNGFAIVNSNRYANGDLRRHAKKGDETNDARDNKEENSMDDEGLPRLAPPLKEENVFSFTVPKTRSDQVVQTITSIAKSESRSQQSPAVKLINKAKAATFTSKQEEAFSTSGLWGLFRSCSLHFIQSPLGGPFRQTYRRRMAVVLLGSPYGEVGIIADSVDAITRLAVSSLKEDSYGNVQRDISRMIRTFTATIITLSNFQRSLGIHWTDVKGKQESPELTEVLGVIRGGLHDLIVAFGDYSGDLGLSEKDMREAREAATPSVLEMKQRGK